MVSETSGCSGVGAGVVETRTSVLSAAGVGVASGVEGAFAGAAGAVKATSVRAVSYTHLPRKRAPAAVNIYTASMIGYFRAGINANIRALL